MSGIFPHNSDHCHCPECNLVRSQVRSIAQQERQDHEAIAAAKRHFYEKQRQARETEERFRMPSLATGFNNDDERFAGVLIGRRKQPRQAGRVLVKGEPGYPQALNRTYWSPFRRVEWRWSKWRWPGTGTGHYFGQANWRRWDLTNQKWFGCAFGALDMTTEGYRQRHPIHPDTNKSMTPGEFSAYISHQNAAIMAERKAQALKAEREKYRVGEEVKVTFDIEVRDGHFHACNPNVGAAVTGRWSGDNVKIVEGRMPRSWSDVPSFGLGGFVSGGPATEAAVKAARSYFDRPIWFGIDRAATEEKTMPKAVEPALTMMELSILFWRASRDRNVRFPDTSSKVSGALNSLAKAELIEFFGASGSNNYVLSARGKAYVDAIYRLPLPVQSAPEWVMPKKD